MKDLIQAIIAIVALLLPIVLIARWRGRGFIPSVLISWGLIAIIALAFPSEKWEDIEFAEDWPRLGWLPLSIWCLLILAVATFFFPVKRPKQPDPRWMAWLKDKGESSTDGAKT